MLKFLFGVCFLLFFFIFIFLWLLFLEGGGGGGGGGGRINIWRSIRDACIFAVPFKDFDYIEYN